MGYASLFEDMIVLSLVPLWKQVASTDIMALWGALHEPMVFFIELTGDGVVVFVNVYLINSLLFGV